MREPEAGPERPVAAPGWLVGAAVAVAVRPALWATAVGQVRRLAAPGWWRRRPFLPLPDPAYLRFRLTTAYGDDRPPASGDVVTYLRWCKDFPAAGKSAERFGARQ